MNKLLSCLLKFMVVMAFIVGTASLVSANGYYEGKIIRIIVGFSPGGGFDTYARVIARHMGKHIPGHPTFIVQNMTGAGSLIAANYVYNVAKPDGLTIGHFIGGLFLGQVLGQPGTEFDARKFEFIGVPVRDHGACVFTKASGITSLEKWMASKTPVKIGGVAPGSSTPDNLVRVLKEALGLPIKLVTGYKGTAVIRLAAETGEVAGSCWGWDSVRATWRKALETGDVVVVLQTTPKPHPDLSDVPLAINLTKTDEARKLIQLVIHDDSTILRTYTLPPRTPKQLVRVLRRAFMKTMKDPEFLADARKVRVGVDPVSGEEVERIIHGLFKLDPAMTTKLKRVLYE
jgi:tripartite-type tricarboxylate transporter receptor subunit TctC